MSTRDQQRREAIERIRAKAIDAKQRAGKWCGMPIGLHWDEIAKSYAELANKMSLDLAR